MRGVRAIRIPGIDGFLGVQDIMDVEVSRSGNLAAAGSSAVTYTLPGGVIIGQVQPDGLFFPAILLGCEEDDTVGATTNDVEWTFTIAGRNLIDSTDADLTDGEAFRSYAGGVRYGQRRPIPLGQYPEGAVLTLTATNRHATATRRVWGAYSFHAVSPENIRDLYAMLGSPVRGAR